jgi:tetratricopeptide (TPR) repeat protein
MKLIRLVIAIIVIHSHIQSVFSQANIKEEMVKFKTYPYSDPDPVAKITKFYPYFRFDGFTNEAREQGWKIVTLENEYIKVLVAPEMGGKVLGAIEKSTGEEFIYFNKVVKFRDIAMRGAWTSGGIEFNFGSIGHAPTTASPVNYILRNNNDGSVSCIIGAPEITSRTEWRVEIRLPENASYFETNALWYNPSDEKTSLYNWMTASVDVSNDLEYFFPGHTEIGHDGEYDSWPVNNDGIKISLYKNNTFGGPKSYHVLGEYAEDFLCYFHNKEFGLGHWSPYDEKPGQKIWLWALSREGEIWADLLTDPGNVQYTEIQTGLLFNQEAVNSTFSPFKHQFFHEGSEHKFTELWFPVKGIGGMIKANEKGTLNIVRNGGKITIGFCANQPINDNLIFTADGKEVFHKTINLKPTEFFNETIEIGSAEHVEVNIGKDFRYNTNEASERKLSKPMKINDDYNWDSADGMLTEGTELEKQRLYKEAREKFEQVLKTDPSNTEALTRMAGLCYRNMEYEKANDFALKALANDTYQPEANYIFGLVSKKLGKKYDALDGFSMAARSVGYKSVANAQIAAICFVEGEMQKCLKYAEQALDYDRYSINALKLKALAFEKTGEMQNRESVLEEILKIDPLNAFARFEKNEGFDKVLNYEMPDQVCLELAISYYNLSLNDKAVQVLKSTKATPILNYWLAYISNDSKLLEDAISASAAFVFPFRSETLPVLEWALTQKNSWKTKYYLGLIYWSKGQISKAKEYFESCENQPDNFAFYLTRFELLNGESGYNGEADLNKAQELAPNEWRCFKTLSDYYEENQQYDKALDWAQKGYSLFPENYILAYQCSKSLLITGKYKEALDILIKTTILPNEGASSGRVTYRQACVLDAIHNFENNKEKLALSRIKMAREWPENLGVGKSYDTDERIEDYLESIYWTKKRDAEKTKALEENIINTTLKAKRATSSDYLGAILMRKAGKQNEAKDLLNARIENEPENVVARWNLAKFNGNNAEAENLIQKIEVQNGGSFFNPRSRDSGLALILAIIEMDI